MSLYLSILHGESTQGIVNMNGHDGCDSSLVSAAVLAQPEVDVPLVEALRLNSWRCLPRSSFPYIEKDIAVARVEDTVLLLGHLLQLEVVHPPDVEALLLPHIVYVHQSNFDRHLAGKGMEKMIEEVETGNLPYRRGHSKAGMSRKRAIAVTPDGRSAALFCVFLLMDNN